MKSDRPGSLLLCVGVLSNDLPAQQQQHNFYKDAYARQGYADVVAEVQSLWLDRRPDEAAARIPDAFVLQANLLGTEEMVKQRIRIYRDAGVTSLHVSPDGRSLEERLETLGRLMALVRTVDEEPAISAA